MIIAPSLLAANFGRLAREVDASQCLRRRLAAPGHHGRAFRAEHLLWSGGGADAAPAHEAVLRRAPDVLEAGDPAGAVRPGRARIRSTSTSNWARPSRRCSGRSSRWAGKSAWSSIRPPPSPWSSPTCEQIDSLLIMTVNPGFWRTVLHLRNAAQDSAGACLAARESASATTSAWTAGVDFKTAAECAHAGADAFISGTTLFGRPNLGAAVKKMRKIVEAART